MRFDIVTIFPKIFDSYLNESLIKRARAKRIIDVRVHDLRKFATDRHHKVDDGPFGGGPGMVLKIEPIFRAVSKLISSGKASKFIGSAKKLANLQTYKLKTRVILFSTRGKKLDAKTAKRLSKYKQLVLICGRYEGVDERVAKYIADEEISIGDYVLSGGELPALVLIEAVSRFLPGFLGKRESLEEIKGSYPVYTRPAVFIPRVNRKTPKVKCPSRGWRVPKVLLSGNHKKIKEWREKNS